MKENEILAPYTSFRIGGPARYFVKVQNRDELTETIRLAEIKKFPYFILGQGTNLLVSDEGFKGLIIKNETSTIRLAGVVGVTTKRKKGSLTKNVFLEVDSGVAINRLVRYTIDQKLAGLEEFLGQPGTVGGAVYINAHNIKGKIFFGDKILSAKVFTLAKGIENVSQDYFNFNYDQSVLMKNRVAVIAVTIQLESIKESDNLWQKAKKAQEYRNKTQAKGFSAGCIFRNIPRIEAIRLTTPQYTTSAGYLIDSSGLKGVSCGQAFISPEHANFIINRGSAKASDVLELINLIKGKVLKKFRLQLTPEIVLLGEF